MATSECNWLALNWITYKFAFVKFVANNYGGKNTMPGFENFDVIIGYMSAEGESSNPKSG